MVLESPTQDGIVVNPIIPEAMKTVQSFTPIATGMMRLVQMEFRATSVALQVR